MIIWFTDYSIFGALSIYVIMKLFWRDFVFLNNWFLLNETIWDKLFLSEILNLFLTKHFHYIKNNIGLL